MYLFELLKIKTPHKNIKPKLLFYENKENTKPCMFLCTGKSAKGYFNDNTHHLGTPEINGKSPSGQL